MDNQNTNNEINEINDVLEQEEVNDIETSTDELTDDNDGFTYTIDNNSIGSDYNGNYNDNKSFMYIIIGASILIGIIVLIIFLVNKGGSSFSYSDIEDKMVSGAKDYYKKNDDKLPITNDGYVTISTDDLIKNSYLKPFSEMVSDDVKCSGYVKVYKSEENYVYFPYLDCGDDYKSVTLADYIIENDLVTSDSGLYHVNDEYIFRGEYPNNYVSFDGKSWRIVGINSDKTLRMFMINEEFKKSVWDDRYNSDSESYDGINDFRVSRMLEYINKTFEDGKFVSDKGVSYLVKKPLCIGRMPKGNVEISSLDFCDDLYDDSYIGLLRPDDVLKSSLASNCVNVYDNECTNYNYFTNVSISWTLNASSSNTTNVFYVGNGFVDYKKASSELPVRPVVNINSNVLFKSGDGTKDNPYVISK